nr:MAG TPA: hypothetical protein [Caudoviricetes sp.]
MVTGSQSVQSSHSRVSSAIFSSRFSSSGERLAFSFSYLSIDLLMKSKFWFISSSVISFLI